jgi:hypothetical protein
MTKAFDEGSTVKDFIFISTSIWNLCFGNYNNWPPWYQEICVPQHETVLKHMYGHFALQGGGILESGLGPLLTPLVSFGISIRGLAFGL